MRLLAITRSCWDNNNNTGNTLTNLFKDFENLEIFNLYLRNDMPRDSICQHFFQITENQLAKSILNKGVCGRLIGIVRDEKTTVQERNEVKLNYIVHSMPFYFPWFVRELLWGIGKWKNKALDDFLNEANPDIIFMPVFPCWYTSKILEYVHSVCRQAKIVLYHADDDYSLKQFNLSPLFWLYRINQRRWVRRITSISSLNYCISEQQVEEYSKDLGCECKLLQKGADISEKIESPIKQEEYPIKFVYTGNLVCGRWKTLAKIGDAIRSLNKERIKAKLMIYSASILTEDMRRKFRFDQSVCWMGRAPATEIQKIQDNADVLIHVEALNILEALEVRLSFSTKIVDYLARGKCIFASGNRNVASIKYFLKYDNAIVATDYAEILLAVEKIVESTVLRGEYAAKALKSADSMHNKSIVHNLFVKEIESLLTEEQGII